MCKKLLYLALTACLALFSCKSTGEAKVKKIPGKKGLIVASFGTSYAETRAKTIEACEEQIRAEFPEYEVRRAFTSNMIRKILKKRDNIPVDSLEEALEKMKNEGFSEVIVQPLHIIPGFEYNIKILDQAEPFKNHFDKLIIGRPVLSTPDDHARAVEALKPQLPELDEGQAVVLMGHGSQHPANASYSCFQLMLDDELGNVLIGNVEGYPEIDRIIKVLRERKFKEVTLMPYMLVAGDHASNDMAGDEEDSWKSILTKEGFKVNIILKGLGENPAYRDIFISNIKDSLAGNPGGYHDDH